MTRKCPFPTAPPLCSRLSHPPRYWATSRNTLCRTATGPWRAWSSSNGHRQDSRQCAVEKKMVRHMAAAIYALIGSISSAPLCSWKHWKVTPHVFQYALYILVLVVFELIVSEAYPSSVDSKAPFIKNKGFDSLTPFDLMLFWFSSCYICVNCRLLPSTNTFFRDKHTMKPQHIWAKYSDLIHWGLGYASALEAFETALCFMTEAPLKKGFHRMSQVGVFQVILVKILCFTSGCHHFCCCCRFVSFCLGNFCRLRASQRCDADLCGR